MPRTSTISSQRVTGVNLNFIRRLLGLDSLELNGSVELRQRLDENEQKVEDLIEMVNILAGSDERMSKDIKNIASHVVLMELSMVDARKGGQVTLKRKSKDDDMIN